MCVYIPLLKANQINLGHNFNSVYHHRSSRHTAVRLKNGEGARRMVHYILLDHFLRPVFQSLNKYVWQITAIETETFYSTSISMYLFASVYYLFIPSV